MTPAARFQLGLPGRAAILVIAFCGEKIFLNRFVNFGLAQEAQGLGAVLRVAQHLGFRFLVAFAGALALFTYVRGWQALRTLDVAMKVSPVRIGWMLAHFLCIAALAPLSFLLYRYTASDLSLAAVIVAWALIAAAAALAALLTLAPLALWRDAARALGVIWWYAAITALLGTGALQLAQMLWEPTAAFTFDLVRQLLAPILPALQADPRALELSTPRFAVTIADQCSGLEGVSLMLAFSGSWLLYFRNEYIFPRALLLIPASVITIFALNVLRIAVLILIGDAGFTDVAVYGFHSQAGWIAFIGVACGLVLLSRRSMWLYRAPAPHDVSPTMHNPTAVYLMPLLAVLAAGSLSHAFSGSFEFLYPLRVIAGLLMLARYRRALAAIDWRCSWRGPAVGVGIFLVWIGAAHFLLPPSAMPAKLAAMPAALRGFWIANRIVGSVLIVPVVEELAYRGYLMRRLVKADFESVPFSGVPWLALAASAVVFGFAHGVLWAAGIAAGLAYGLLVIRRGRLGESVAAHAVTNGLIALGALFWGQWQLW